MKYPKQKNSHCPNCNAHRVFKATQYKTGKASTTAQGKRRYDMKQKGFGGQTKPVFRKKAKTTRKITLKLQCVKCRQVKMNVIGRLRAFEMLDMSKAKKK